jgi:hypothetical protein
MCAAKGVRVPERVNRAGDGASARQGDAAFEPAVAAGTAVNFDPSVPATVRDNPPQRVVGGSA